jgi:hypothetical protein
VSPVDEPTVVATCTRARPAVAVPLVAAGVVLAGVLAALGSDRLASTVFLMACIGLGGSWWHRVDVLADEVVVHGLLGRRRYARADVAEVQPGRGMAGVRLLLRDGRVGTLPAPARSSRGYAAELARLREWAAG